MTVREAIEKTDKLYPNVFPFTVKAMWLQEFDLRVFSEIFMKYTDGGIMSVGGYATEPEKQLLIPDEYGEVYLRYLAMQFDITAGDTARYYNSAALYNTCYLAFMNYYNRTHNAKPCFINIE